MNGSENTKVIVRLTFYLTRVSQQRKSTSAIVTLALRLANFHVHMCIHSAILIYTPFSATQGNTTPNSVRDTSVIIPSLASK